MSNLRAQTLEVEGDVDTERLQVTGNAEVFALSWLDDGPPAPIAIVGSVVRNRYVATKNAVDRAAAAAVPIGSTVLWAGSTTSIPPGWALSVPPRGTFAGLQYITKVADPPIQPAQCLLPDEPPCEPLDCVTEWGAWSTCPADAQPGDVRTRARVILQARRAEGEPCPAIMTESEPCPVDCKLGDWRDWTMCPDDADETTMQTRERPVLRVATDGGTCPPTTESRHCPVHCKFSWSRWSACNKDCGQGQGVITRTPVITRQPLHGGNSCPQPETSPCQLECNYVFDDVESGYTATIKASGPGMLHILVVGGGGGTAASGIWNGSSWGATNWNTGGGGAGGVVYRTLRVSAGFNRTIAVYVGRGGSASNASRAAGFNGQESQFGKIKALGGQGSQGGNAPQTAGASGGGGASDWWFGAGTENQGHAGAAGYNDKTKPAGGGGGAGGPGRRGTNASNQPGGKGGIGIYFGRIFGTAVGDGGTFGRGGDGGGTRSIDGKGSSGAPNTGNGASGVKHGTPGSWPGGSGVIVVRAIGQVTLTSTRPSMWMEHAKVRKNDVAATSVPEGAVEYTAAFSNVTVEIASSEL